MVALSCPHCGNKKNVIKFGTNRSGTPRCRCLDCKKTFTPAPKSRALSPEKQAAIERALAERVGIGPDRIDVVTPGASSCPILASCREAI